MSLILAALLRPVNDITTTPNQPPAFVYLSRQEETRNRDWAYHDESAHAQAQLYPDLKPLHSPLTAIKLFEQVMTFVKAQTNWTIWDVDEANFRVEATATTPFLKFKDDVVIQIQPGNPGSTVHVRSKSRVGKSDLGANYKRIQAILTNLTNPE